MKRAAPTTNGTHEPLQRKYEEKREECQKKGHEKQ